MCFNAQLVLEWDAFASRFNRRVEERVREQRTLPIHHASAFARPLWPVITAESPEEVQLLRWGLVPFWAKDPAVIARQTANCRSETMFSLASFRDAARKGRRCLIPATGGFESMTIGKLKIPHFFHRLDGEAFCFAGLYEPGVGGAEPTYTMLTTVANPLFAYIHNAPRHSEEQRMPVIIPRAFENDWLYPHLSEQDVLRFCVPFANEELEAWPVSKRANQAKEVRDTPDITARVAWPELTGEHR